MQIGQAYYTSSIKMILKMRAIYPEKCIQRLEMKKKTWNLSLPGKYELRGADVIVLIPDELKFKAETLLGMNNVVEEWQRMIH